MPSAYAYACSPDDEYELEFLDTPRNRAAKVEREMQEGISATIPHSGMTR